MTSSHSTLRLQKLVSQLTPNFTDNYDFETEIYDKWKALEGKEMAPSEWLTMTQKKIDGFSDVTIDHNYIHKSNAKKNGSPFGDTIAHGLLSLSFAPYFVYQVTAKSNEIPKKHIRSLVNYGFDKVRFLNPVFVDNRIRGVFTIKNVTKGKKPHSIRYLYEVKIENENKNTKEINTAAIAQWIGMTIYK